MLVTYSDMFPNHSAALPDVTGVTILSPKPRPSSSKLILWLIPSFGLLHTLIYVSLQLLSRFLGTFDPTDTLLRVVSLTSKVHDAETPYISAKSPETSPYSLGNLTILSASSFYLSGAVAPEIDAFSAP